MIRTKILKASTGKREAHSMITIDNPTLPFLEQVEEISRQYDELLASLGDGMTPVFRRWFLSDAVNQQPSLPDDGMCATSVVEQPPLDLTKVALWVWMVEDAVVTKEADGRYAVEAFGHTHIFEGGCARPGMDPYHAMLFMLTSTEEALREREGSLLDSCVRTWLFVQNVDVDYAEVVKGRNQAFGALGLTPSTRFIASTGIGGRQADRTSAVGMDTYSVIGLKEGQMRQVNAPDHLNPTYEYGVAFERATSVDYDDRSHLFVSGTASIDNRGRVVWEGAIRRQTERMWENVGSLLDSASFGWEDVGQIIVYLRDPADYAVVGAMFAERFPDTPYVILYAPVCRPGWLIEMECMAMRGR
ncbi:MAG: hypothetical protein K2L68_07170 [Muribaculaceae bacterium]|nr:hypothetical protein [Muribaculaceae bacterium]